MESTVKRNHMPSLNLSFFLFFNKSALVLDRGQIALISIQNVRINWQANQGAPQEITSPTTKRKKIPGRVIDLGIFLRFEGHIGVSMRQVIITSAPPPARDWENPSTNIWIQRKQIVSCNQKFYYSWVIWSFAPITNHASYYRLNVPCSTKSINNHSNFFKMKLPTHHHKI